MRLAILLLCLVAGAPVSAADSVSESSFAVKADLISETGSFQPGKPFWVAVRLTMKPDWHVNWVNPGDAGLAPTVTWDLPRGFAASELHWPYPRRFISAELSIFGYEGDVLLLAQITPPALSEGRGSAVIKARVDWLACKDVCIPGSADLELELETGRTGDAGESALFRRTRQSLPVAAVGWRFAAELSDDKLAIRATPPTGETVDLSDVVLFPEGAGLVENAAAQDVSRDGKSFILSVPRASLGVEAPPRLRGVLVSKNGWGRISQKAVTIDVPLDAISD